MYRARNRRAADRRALFARRSRFVSPQRRAHRSKRCCCATRSAKTSRRSRASADASGVMMIPIPRRGVYRGVDGEADARSGAATSTTCRSRRSRTRLRSAARKGKAIWDSSSRARDAARRRTGAARRAREAALRRSTGRSRRLRSNDVRRPTRSDATLSAAGRTRAAAPRPSPKKKSSMCLADQLLRLLLPRHQAVLVEDHLHPLFPQLPRLRRDVLVDPLAEFAGPGRCVESRNSF